MSSLRETIQAAIEMFEPEEAAQRIERYIVQREKDLLKHLEIKEEINKSLEQIFKNLEEFPTNITKTDPPKSQE